MPVEAGQVVPPLSPRSHSTSVVLPGCFSTCSPWSICSRTCPGSFTRKCTMERQAGQEDNCQVQILQQVLSISESRLPKMGWSFVSESRGALGSCEVKWSCLWYQRGLEDPVQICYCTAGLFWILSGNHTGVGSAHANLHANGAVLVSYSQCLRTLRKTGELMRHCTRQVLADFRGSCVLSPQASTDVGIYCPCESGFCVAPRNFVYLQEKKAFSSRDLDSVFDG